MLIWRTKKWLPFSHGLTFMKKQCICGARIRADGICPATSCLHFRKSCRGKWSRNKMIQTPLNIKKIQAFVKMTYAQISMHYYIHSRMNLFVFPCWTTANRQFRVFCFSPIHFSIQRACLLTRFFFVVALQRNWHFIQKMYFRWGANTKTRCFRVRASAKLTFRSKIVVSLWREHETAFSPQRKRRFTSLQKPCP